jgi:energy-coupling factor transport system substrate-specific component
LISKGIGSLFSAPFQNKGAFFLDNQQTSDKSFYFSTRDLLIMAVLAALGGVTSTYVNTIGNATQAALGFPGATQWAAGLHTIWIVLAMGILNKTGTGTLIGLVKGTVELMSGNTHGVIILLVNLVAGLLVDFGFIIFRDKRNIAPYLAAGALSAGSNVIVFQLFATLPANIIAMSAILILTLVAAISGVIFSGIAPFYLIRTLIKANVIKRPISHSPNRKLGWLILSGVFIIAILLAAFLRSTLRGPATIWISGAISNPYEFPNQEHTIEPVIRQMLYRGVQTEYFGYPLSEVVDYAQPSLNADSLLIEASDGYKFLISLDELNFNPNLLIVQQGQGQNAAFDLVGPESSKAWVRNVIKIMVAETRGLTIQTASGKSFTFNPDDWLADMDSTEVSLPTGSQKLQGVPLWKVIESSESEANPVTISVLTDQDSTTYDWQAINGDDSLRIFTVISDEGFQYALGTMSGEVQLYPLTRIEVE